VIGVSVLAMSSNLENDWRVCDDLLLFIGWRSSYHFLSFVREDIRNLFLGSEIPLTFSPYILIHHVTFDEVLVWCSG
jgi:hypothetical protein